MKTIINYQNRFITVVTGYGSSGGDMKKSVYDADNDGVVDNSKRLDGLTVGELLYDDSEVRRLIAGKEDADPHIVKDNKNNTFTKSQKGNIVQLIYAANVSLDLSLSNRYSLTLTGNCQIDNPTNLTDGQGGIIYITQDATGGHTVTWDTNYVFINSPSEDTTVDKTNMYAYETYNGKVILQHIGAF